MRLCMKLGLRSLETNGFDEAHANAASILPGDLAAKALAILTNPPAIDRFKLRLNEDPPPSKRASSK